MQQPVAAGKGDLEGAPADRLAADVGEVRARRAGLATAAGRRLCPGLAGRPPAGRAASSIRAGTTTARRRRRAPVDRRSARRPRPARPPGTRRRRRPGAPRPAAAAGTTTRRAPRRTSAATIGRMPGTGRSSPPSESSPMNAQRPVARTCSEPSRIPTAIARSSDAPALRRSAGARFTVIRRGGKARPLLRIAPRTRSRASCRAASGRPTIVNPAGPGPRRPRPGSPGRRSPGAWRHGRWRAPGHARRRGSPGTYRLEAVGRRRRRRRGREPSARSGRPAAGRRRRRRSCRSPGRSRGATGRAASRPC